MKLETDRSQNDLVAIKQPLQTLFLFSQAYSFLI